MFLMLYGMSLWFCWSADQKGNVKHENETKKIAFRNQSLVAKL